jgi:hypothetical protein
MGPRPALEAVQSWVRSGGLRLARTVDSWFGDRPFDDDGKLTGGRLDVGLFKRQDQKFDVDLRFRAHYRLPNAERYSYLFIGRDNPRTVIQDTPEALRQSQALVERPAERSLLAGLGVSLPGTVDFRLGVGGGLRPYAQARYDRPWTLAPGHEVDFRETVFWSRADRWGSTTALSYDLALTPTVAVRWLNSATFTQTSRRVEWSSNLAAFRSFSLQRLLSFELLANGAGTSGPGAGGGASDLGWLLRWDQPVYGKGLIGEAVVGRFWPRPDVGSPRGRAWAAGASLKMHF